VAQQRFGNAQVDGAQTFVTALDPVTGPDALRLEFSSGSFAALEQDAAVLVSQAEADAAGLATGDSVELVLPNGEQRRLEVGGVFATNQTVTGFVVALDTVTAAGAPDLDQYVYVALDDGADAAAVRDGLEAALAGYPVVTVKDRGEFTQETKDQVGQLLLLVNALLVLSIVIAVLGIVNTLALSVIERTREIGLLRAVGMGRGQLRRMVRLESVVISLYGAVLGLALGAVLGLSLVTALRTQGIEVVSVPGGRLLAFLVTAGLVGVLAAVWPARRAARLRVLDAIATA
jgi:putative ABC transport system permease protein